MLNLKRGIRQKKREDEGEKETTRGDKSREMKVKNREENILYVYQPNFKAAHKLLMDTAFLYICSLYWLSVLWGTNVFPININHSTDTDDNSRPSHHLTCAWTFRYLDCGRKPQRWRSWRIRRDTQTRAGCDFITFLRAGIMKLIKNTAVQMLWLQIIHVIYTVHIYVWHQIPHYYKHAIYLIHRFNWSFGKTS